MKIAEIGSFLNPFGDALATTFVLTLIILTILTVVWLVLSAKESNWEKNWYGGDLNDSTNNLDGDHGSVQELSDAVATKAEKVADIMPSMLLIVGLLGTFLGLGIALNKASTVLAMADTAGMDAAMSQLMGLMDGLGAKFKTSTWGILCFILLNLLFNIFGFKEKRLTWAIQKVRAETEEKAQAIQTKDLKRHDDLMANLQNIDNSAVKDSQLLRESLSSLSEAQMTSYKENNTQLQTLLLEVVKVIKTTSDSAQNANQLLVNSLASMNTAHLDNNKNNHAELTKVLLDHNQIIEKRLQEQSNALGKGFNSVIKIKDDMNKNSRNLMNDLSKAHEQTLAENEKLLNNMQTSLDENNKVATKNSKDSIEQLKKIAGYNEATQKSMQDFVEQTVGSMKSIGKSADKMAGAATAVGSSAEGLNDVVKNLRGELESIMSLIKEDLSETISHMSESFEDNVTSMSKNMGEATLGISKAVDELSTSVDSTMTDVTNVISESMELQRKSANEFTVTSETLNVQIFEMTDLVKQLSGDITSGLKAVSESGRRMKSLDSRYAKYSDLIESITETNQKLFTSIANIAENLPTMVDAVPKLSASLKDTLTESVDLQKQSRGTLKNLSDEIKKVVSAIPELSEDLKNTLVESVKVQEQTANTIERLSSNIESALTSISQQAPANTLSSKKDRA